MMHRLLIFVALLSLAPTVADAQTTTKQEKSPRKSSSNFTRSKRTEDGWDLIIGMSGRIISI